MSVGKQTKAATAEEREWLYRMMMEWSQHVRHDRLNEIQVLLGYIKLGKQERLSGYIDAMRRELDRESRLAKLGVPELVVFLLTCPMRWRHLKVDVHTGAEQGDSLRLDKLAVDVRAITRIVSDVIALMAESAPPADGDTLHIELGFSMEADRLHVRIESIGKLQEEGLATGLKSFMDELSAAQDGNWNYTIGEDRATVEVRIPVGKPAR